MKNKIMTFTITGVIAVMSLSAIAQEDKKAAKARKEVSEAKKDLKEAKVDSAADFQRFKQDAENKIRDNQNKIALLKAKKADDNKEIRDKYNKKVLAIETQNDELKTKIKEANTTKTDMWSSFKRGFNHDMEAVENAIKNI